MRGCIAVLFLVLLGQAAFAAPSDDPTWQRVPAPLATTGDPDAPVDASGRLAITVPGPVRGAGNVRLSVPRASAAGAGNALEIFAVNGRRLAHRDLGALAAGAHTLPLAETRGLRAGVYFARVRVGGAVATARFVALP